MAKKKNKIYLSASRMGTLEKCSWLYWCKYVLKLPDSTNTGALRGTICHLVFELLLKPRHKRHFVSITERDSIKGSKSVNKLVKKFMDGQELFAEENYKEDYELIDKMIVVGLNHNFFGKEGGVIDCPEQEFRIENKKPRYNIYGFMDKPIKYKKEGLVKIVDYKSSKNKFRGEELTSNVQAMMYTLAAKKLWPKIKKIIIQFLFLKFPRSPKQELEFNEDTVKGFEHYLEQMQIVVENFDEPTAKSNFAANTNKRWLCGPAKSGWICPYHKPFDYYALVDKKGEIIKSSHKDDLKPEKGQELVKKSYSGCPHFNLTGGQVDDFLDLEKKSSTQGEDLFDF